MVKLRNLQPFDAMIPTGPFTGIEVGRGEVVDVSDELAAGLLLQASNWQVANEAPVEDPPAAKKKVGDR